MEPTLPGQHRTTSTRPLVGVYQSRAVEYHRFKVKFVKMFEAMKQLKLLAIQEASYA